MKEIFGRKTTNVTPGGFRKKVPVPYGKDAFKDVREAANKFLREHTRTKRVR